MQGHNAHAERPCNLALQASLPRQIFCLRKKRRDFCWKMFPLLAQKSTPPQPTAEVYVYNIALLTCAFPGINDRVTVLYNDKRLGFPQILVKATRYTIAVSQR